MNDFQFETLKNICVRPGMFIVHSSFQSVCAYMDGLHQATGCLTGFREWLVVRADTGNNLAWEGLVKLIIRNEGVSEDDRIRRLGELLDEFHQYTGSTTGATSGLMRVYVRYHGWLLNQPWYKPNRTGYVPPYNRSGPKELES